MDLFKEVQAIQSEQGGHLIDTFKDLIQRGIATYNDAKDDTMSTKIRKLEQIIDKLLTWNGNH